ncbi:MAG: hypothetical protein MZV64_18185 [Ignavibacteriales bacterium]|nr:hypothetical protein [Ignavibacteriales bacterium]
MATSVPVRGHRRRDGLGPAERARAARDALPRPGRDREAPARGPGPPRPGPHRRRPGHGRRRRRHPHRRSGRAGAD